MSMLCVVCESSRVLSGYCRVSSRAVAVLSSSLHDSQLHCSRQMHRQSNVAPATPSPLRLARHLFHLTPTRRSQHARTTPHLSIGAFACVVTRRFVQTLALRTPHSTAYDTGLVPASLIQLLPERIAFKQL